MPFSGAKDGRHYWLTPPQLLAELQAEFHFNYDPCPYPKPEDFDGLDAEWGDCSYVNPPFGVVIHEGKKKGATAWVRKAIKEYEKGKKVVFVYPIDKWVLMLIAAGATIRNLYDVKWCATEDGQPGKGTGRHIAMFVLDPAVKGTGLVNEKETRSMAYDSREDVMAHQQEVHRLITLAMANLLQRAFNHDNSKLHEPEKATFDQYVPMLEKIPYGTPDYRATLRNMGPAIKHHYENNSHHPEHFPLGVNDMSLMDIVEMLCDWKAASERNPGGNFLESMVINRERFNLSDQLFDIMLNTARELWGEK